MIREFFKTRRTNKKIDAFLSRYKIPTSYLHINRKNVANAMFVGLFFSMMPMPFQMVAVIFCMTLIKFNVPLALMLVWISNPLSMPFIMYGQYLLGNWVLDLEAIETIRLTIEWFENNLVKVFYPLFVGALISGIALGIIGKISVNYLWRHSIKKERAQKSSTIR